LHPHLAFDARHLVIAGELPCASTGAALKTNPTNAANPNARTSRFVIFHLLCDPFCRMQLLSPHP